MVGDHVIYKQFAGTKIKIEEENILFTEDDFLVKYKAVDEIPEYTEKGEKYPFKKRGNK